MLEPIKFIRRNSDRRDIWLFRCSCGKEKEIQKRYVDSGHTKSCGCQKRVSMLKAQAKTLTHGMHKTRTYRTWNSMKNRCNYPRNPDYARYGGRGITYCKKWETFEGFLEDMGERPEGRTLDRINNDKGYYKSNCRWATYKEQVHNRGSKKI